MSMKPEDLQFDAWPKRLKGMIFGMPKGVQVTHLPSGLFVCVDCHRHQIDNKKEAMQKLEALLAEYGHLKSEI